MSCGGYSSSHKRKAGNNRIICHKRADSLSSTPDVDCDVMSRRSENGMKESCNTAKHGKFIEWCTCSSRISGGLCKNVGIIAVITSSNFPPEMPQDPLLINTATDSPQNMRRPFDVLHRLNLLVSFYGVHNLFACPLADRPAPYS